MRENQNQVYRYLCLKVKDRHISLADLAERCGMSRSTLYRNMKNPDHISSDLLNALCNSLQLTSSEEHELRTLFTQKMESDDIKSAFSILDTMLLGTAHVAKPKDFTFSYYANNERYLRTGREIIETIETSADTALSVSVHVIGGFEDPICWILNDMLIALLTTTPNIHIEHLLNLPPDDIHCAAQAFACALSLMVYQNYEAYYSEMPAANHNLTALDNLMLIEIISEEPTNSCYFAVVFHPNGLSQCIRYSDPQMARFILSSYECTREYYRKSIVSFKNISVLGEQLADFERDGVYCLIKPDFCYNYIPPEVYKMIFSRMNSASIHTFLKALTGKNQSKDEEARVLSSLQATLTQRYMSTYDNINYFICSVQGILRFAQTGCFSDSVIPFPPLRVAERKLILEKIIHRISQPHNTLRVILMEEPILSNRMIISVNAVKGILIDYGKNTIYGICQNVYIENRSLCDLFIEYASSTYAKHQEANPESVVVFLKNLLQKMK